MAATTSGSGGGSQQKYLAEALKRFARSIELCDDYLRGYYGLKLVSFRWPSYANKISYADRLLGHHEAPQGTGQTGQTN